ncbi:type 1 glutamine amidotransferase domain-containing protein [Phyllobacterium sp. SB3]|uniref:type 1 glutamine amidotransferase domain-containing protein n=1 Tax=Phyllobacterium sp. SB3 TaxID=3156073 RepID=UPI0032AF61CA
MKRIKSIVKAIGLVVALAITYGAPAEAQTSKGKVLVVMSGGHLLTLKDGKPYATGYYLNEVAVPLQALINAGYTPVFANPNGDTPSMDASSNVDKFFGGDSAKRFAALRLIDSLPGLRQPLKLSEVVGKTKEYAAIFVPGGHAPMIDLVSNKDLGAILRDFHETGRPTALICHGPMALISTLPDAARFDQALNSGDMAALPQLAHDFPYAGYRVAIFSKAEEQEIEAPQLGGPAPYYNDEAMTAAGANVQNAEPWHPNVVQDRELITGQQPFSDSAFADALLAKLAARGE